MCSLTQPQELVAVDPVAGAAQPRQGGSLGNNADFATEIAANRPPIATVRAFLLRSKGRDLLSKSGFRRRMMFCGKRIAPNKNSVAVYKRPDRAYGRVGGICVCGQSICCPVCAPRIAAFRANEAAEAFRRAKNLGWAVSLETFTKPHELDSRPNALLLEFRKFSDLWRKYQSGGRASRRERGAQGHHLAREVNWGDSGWHYHHHRLRYDLPGTFLPDVAKLQWLEVLEGAGLHSRGTWAHAYRCDLVGDEAGARYVAKLALSVEAESKARVGLPR